MAGVEFIIDRTEPTISGITILSEGLAIEEHEYARTNSVQVMIEASDTYGQAEPGIVAGFYWLLSPVYIDDPVLTGYIPAGQEFFLSSLENGVHYLYVRAVDMGGNESTETLVRLMRIDADEPGPPEIESSSHKRAQFVTDAVALSDARFTITPTSTGASGIVGYAFQLSKGLHADTAGVVTTGSVEVNIIEINDLADNLENEFYYLAVMAIGGNQKQSQAALYTFRIDSSPPRNLTIFSSTHSNPLVYYPVANALLSWNRPLDFTGVKSYYYTLSTESILPDPLPEDYTPDGDWQATTRQSLSVNLLDLIDPSGLAKDGAGKIFIAVCAGDFSGNRQYDQISVCFDTVKPVIDEDSINITAEKSDRSAFISWNLPEDNIELSHSELKLALVQADNTLTYLSNIITKNNTELQQHTFSGLDPDESIIYVVFLKAIDQAGNEKSVYKGFSFSGQPVILNLAIPFIENILGYTVRGKFSTDPGRQQAELVLPLALRLSLGDDEPVFSEYIGFTELEFDGDGVFVYGSDPDIVFNVQIAGYSFTGTGLSFNRFSGLMFNELVYTTRLNQEDERSFVYTDVQVSSPPQIIFLPGFSVSEDPGFSFQSFRRPLPGQNPPEPPLPGWLFTDITSTGFAEQSWILGPGFLDLNDIKETVSACRLENDTKIYSLPVTNVGISPEGYTDEGEITGSFYLETALNLFHVHKALIRGEKIIILEAEILFAYGVTDDTVLIYNFSIDIDGNIQEEPGFYVTPFQFLSDNLIFTANELHFLDNYLIITDGNFIYGDGQLSFNDLIMTYNGANYELPAGIPYFTGEFFGFTVTSQSGQLTEQGISLPGAQIHMPAIFGGGQQTIYELIVSLEDNTIIRTGAGTVDFNIQTIYSTAGGSNVRVLELALRPDGLYASRFTVPIPPFLLLDQGQIELNNLQLHADGSVGVSDTGTTTVNINLAGFHLAGSEASFDGQILIFGSFTLTLTENYYPQHINFSGLAVDWDSVIAAGRQKGFIELYTYGWNISLQNFNLDRDGLVGTGQVQLPGEFGYRVVEFPQFHIFPDGTYIPKFPDIIIHYTIFKNKF